MTKRKTALMFAVIMLFGIIIINISFVSAVDGYFNKCFQPGEKYTYCGTPERTCDVKSGFCMACVSYNAEKKCYSNHNPSSCKSGCSDESSGSPIELDVTPPQFQITSPIKNTIYNSRRIDLKLTLNEIADIQYRDLNKSTISWTRVCSKCPVSTSSNPYLKSITFKEGQNNLLFKAVDGRGNPTEVEVNFFVDSVKPTLSTALPRANSFADGSFQIKFRELNPKRVTLHYGTDKANLDLSKCTYASNQYLCTIDVNLNKYTGQTIGYYFEVEDIAGTAVSSRSTQIKVDTKSPVLNNPDSFFKIVNKRYVEFNLSINEDNLYKVTSKNTLNPRSPTTTLCTKLTNGYCYKKVAFTKGDYSLSIEISDKAGNIIAVPATFTIDY